MTNRIFRSFASIPANVETIELEDELLNSARSGQPAIPRHSRRQFLRTASLASAGAIYGLSAHPQNSQPGSIEAASVPMQGSPDRNLAPDYRIEIREVEWDLSTRKKVRTAAYNGRIPGDLIRLKEGKPVSIQIVNHLDHPEIVHWHGQWIPPDVDGAMEEGSPMISPSGQTTLQFTPSPSGLHWYHTHFMARRNLKHGLYSGQFGPLYVEPRQNPGNYDKEEFLVLHDWEPYYMASDDGSLMVNYAAASVNGRMLGYDEPIRVQFGQRVLFHIVNASATEPHWLSLPGHHFQVLALDGRPVPTQASVEVLRLGPAERISAFVAMTNPGTWILGEPREAFRNVGLGTVIEYHGSKGKPQFTPPAALQWDYRFFADATPVVQSPDITIPMVFTSRFEGHGALDRWMINGKSWPDTTPIPLQPGRRHRLVFDNRSTDDHPVHLHRHAFELVSIRGARLSGVLKDVVIVEARTTVEVDLVANHPGDTLFHCHQQDHMDSGFMTLFRYV